MSKIGRTSRRIVALVAMMLCVSLLSAHAQILTSRDLCEKGYVPRGTDHWEAIGAPAFTAGPPALSGYETDALDPDHLYVTNGVEIMASRDAGCSFESIFPVDDQVVVPGTSIVDLATSASPRAHEHLYVAVNGGPSLLPQVYASRDRGATWEPAGGGLPPVGAIDEVLISDSDPDVVYAHIKLSSNQIGTDTRNWWEGAVSVIYRSDDAGATWVLADDPTAAGVPEDPIEEIIGGDLPTREFIDVAIDPGSATDLWASSAPIDGGAVPDSVQSAKRGGLLHSRDGGATWELIPQVTGPTGVIDITRPRGSDASQILAFQEVPNHSEGANIVYRSRDGGRTFSPLFVPGPEDVESAAQRDGAIVISLASAQYGRVFRNDPGTRDWDRSALSMVRLPFHDLSVAGVGRSSRFFAWTSSALVRTGTPVVESPPFPPLPDLPDVDPDCTAEVTAPKPEPAPPADEPIFVSNFESFELVRFDRFGHGTVAGLTPRSTESIALDEQDRVIAATRFSNTVVRFDDTTGETEPIAVVPSAEGPAFTADGRLYVNDNKSMVVYEFEPGLEPGSIPREAYRFQPNEFTEDIKVAHESSDDRGNLLVLVSRPTLPLSDPTVVASLRRTEAGLERQHDFIEELPDGIVSLGLAVHPWDGRVLIPDFNGSGRILEFDRNGTYLGDFACVDQGTELLKIDISKSGYVYVTGRLPSTGGHGFRQGVLLRFDPEGTRLAPDFSAFMNYPVGVAVPHQFNPPAQTDPPVTKDPPGGSPTVQQRGGGLPPKQPPPPPFLPPPQPVVDPHVQVQPLPNVVQAPQAQSQSQANQQANPNAALAQQRQEQPQMAFVHAAQQLKDQLSGEHAMARTLQRRSDPLAAAKFGLAMGALSMMILYGLASATARRVAVQRTKR